MKGKRVVLAVVAVALAAGAGLFVACAERGQPDEDDRGSGATRLTEPEDAVSQDLMIALAQAKNLHHKAKVYMSDGNLGEAVASVRQILAVRTPDRSITESDMEMRLLQVLRANGLPEPATQFEVWHRGHFVARVPPRPARAGCSASAAGPARSPGAARGRWTRARR